MKPKNDVGEQRHRHHRHHQLDQAHGDQRGDQLARPQRAHHQVAEVARPDLLEERDREAELAAHQDVPQQHRADEQAGRLGGEARSSARGSSAGSPTSASAPAASRSARRCAARTSGSRTSSAAPCRRCAAPMRPASSARAAATGADGAGAASLTAPSRASSTPRRAMARNTSSRLARPKRLISSAGVSSAMMRPFSSMITRSARRSTSAMLCEASTTVAPWLAAIALELGAHPVGGVGIERGRRLVEQQQLGLVEQRLGEAHARLLPGRQLAVAADPAGRRA